MRPPPFSPTNIKRALITKLRHHGDVLLTSPVFSVLKTYAPNAEIDALVYADTEEMLSFHPAISQIHAIDRQWKKLGFYGQCRAEWQLIQALRRRQYDLVIHLTDHPRGAWIARISGATWAVTRKLRGRGQWWYRSFTHHFPLPGHALRHTVETNLDALRALEIYPEDSERGLTFVPGAAAEAHIDECLQGLGLHGKGFIHIHPASRWLFKCWTLSGMINLITHLQEAGHAVVLTSAPSHTEEEMIQRIQAGLTHKAHSLAGTLSLKALGALSARARLFIGVDSAPMHIAAAVGTPCVALFGPSGDKEWGPWHVPHRIITSEKHPCRPCGLDGCGGGKLSDCLTSLPIDQVLSGVDALLRETES